LKKLRLKKQRLSEDLLKAENSEKYRLYGELITANLHLIKTGDKEARVTNYYDGSPITIPLDVRYAPSKNAQMYFKKYSKSKTAIVEKKKQLKETDDDITYIESVAGFIDNARTTDEIDQLRTELTDAGFLRRRKTKGLQKKQKSKPYEYFTASGMRILAGRNNRENDELTLKSFWENTSYNEDYMHITLTDEDDIPDVLTKLRVIYKNIMKLDYDNKRTRTANEINGTENVKEKTPFEHFSEFYELQNGQPLNEEQTVFIANIIEQIWEDK
jgi:hypothetical protein